MKEVIEILRLLAKAGIMNKNYVNKEGFPMPTEQSPVLTGAQNIIGQIRQVVVGKDQVLMWVLATILSGGHILLEDIPGVGKTRKAALLKRFGSVKAIAAAELAELETVLPKKAAEAVYKSFREGK